MAKPTRSNRDWKDEYTLLCEKCGYVVDGLNTSGPCPECGKPIAESLPGSRPGTPYQRSRGYISLIQTAWLTIHHPKRAIEMMSFEGDGTQPRSPLASYLTYSVVACVALVMLDMPSKSISVIDFIIFLGIITFIGVLIWCAFFIITIMCAYIIHFISVILNPRSDVEISWVIATHASIGWSFTGFAWVAGWHTDRLIRYLVPTHSEWHSRTQTMGLIDTVIQPAFFGGIVLGSLIFGYIAYIGICNTKYINLSRPGELNNG